MRFHHTDHAADDPNPYAAKFEDESRPHPVKDIKYHKATGWEREEAL